jgi:serine/threonine protein kinase
MPGQMIIDRYTLERPIGRGGMGTVWLASDQRLGRNVAIKQIGLLPGETTPDLARAMREARSSAVLNHPHVVSVYDVVEEKDQIWLVMEHVECRTLGQIIEEDGPLTPETAVVVVAQVADGLSAAHAAGTIHRDVKPGNILVTADWVAKISDFGIARAHDQGQLTQTGMVIGTPEYFAPELARGEHPTPAVDVWALGATMYAAVEGHPPYPHQSNALALLATIASTPPPRAQNAGFLTDPIARMLEPEPESRWSMKDTAHVLQRLQERHARELTRQSTAAIAAEHRPTAGPGRAAAPTPAASRTAPGRTPEVAGHPPDDRGRRPMGGRLMLAGLAGVLALIALFGFFLLHQGSSPQPSATSHHPGTGSAHRTTETNAPPTSTAPASTTPTSPTRTAPTTPSSTTPPSGVSHTRVGGRLTGQDAQQFVRNYYATLPSDTRSAWSALSSGFQARIGGYDRYSGFWSTISSVSIGRTTAVGNNAVDVALTYTRSDGHVDSEVRRIYLEQKDAGYVISGDGIVG